MELIKINKQGLVSGKELHKFLEVGRDFSTWIKDKIKKYDFVENSDFAIEVTTPQNGGIAKDYAMTIEMSKELSMVENNEKGKEARKYFIQCEKKFKENTLNTQNLSPELQMFNKMFQAVANVELSNKELVTEVQAIKQSNEKTKEEIQGIRDITGLSSVDWRTDSKNLIVKMAHKLGGNQFINELYKEIYSILERRAGCQLKIRLLNKQKKMALEGVCKSKINAASKLDIIGEDKKLLECFLAIVKEMAIKYGA